MVPAIWEGVCAAGDGREYNERIDCFRSGLEGPLAGVEVALEGLEGGFGCPPPKKSNPSNDSVGLEGRADEGSTRCLVAIVLAAAVVG